MRSLRHCVNLKTKSRKDAKGRKEKTTTLYTGYYLCAHHKDKIRMLNSTENIDLTLHALNFIL